MKKTILVALLLISACQTQRVVFNPSAEREGQPVHNNGFETFFVHGVGQNKDVYLNQLCGSAKSVYEVQVKESFVNGLIGGLTYNIYSPRQSKVYCVDK